MQHHAELSSLATQLAELTARITAIGESYVGGPDEDVAGELFEIERSLRSAHRRLARLRGR